MDSGEGNLRLKGDSHSAEGTGALGGWNWHLLGKSFAVRLSFGLKFTWIFLPPDGC